jgi:hypothetical protein
MTSAAIRNSRNDLLGTTGTDRKEHKKSDAVIVMYHDVLRVVVFCVSPSSHCEYRLTVNHYFVCLPYVFGAFSTHLTTVITVNCFITVYLL